MTITCVLRRIKFRDILGVEHEFTARFHEGDDLEVVRFVEQFESGCSAKVVSIQEVKARV